MPLRTVVEAVERPSPEQPNPEQRHPLQLPALLLAAAVPELRPGSLTLPYVLLCQVTKIRALNFLPVSGRQPGNV
jgi:hypothetical protein